MLGTFYGVTIMPLFSKVLMCFDMPFFSEIFVDRNRRGRLVSWVEKASLDHISWLLEITEGERNHELLLSMNNLLELGINPFPYIVPVIPRSLSTVLIKGEHFVLADLLKSISGSSSQAGVSQDPQAEIAQGAQVNPNLAPQEAKKKKGQKGKKAGQVKAVGFRVGGFCGLGESSSSFRRGLGGMSRSPDYKRAS